MGFFLLVIAGLVAWFFISAMNRAKRRMAYADAQAAKRELAEAEGAPHRKPTWVGDRDRMEIVVNGVLNWSLHNGIPVSFASTYFTEQDKIGELMHYLALLERRGSRLTDQQIAAGEFIAGKFIILPMATKKPFIEQDAREMAGLKS